MKILNISYSDKFGGAAKSAYRIHKLLNSIKKIKSDMLVVKKLSTDKNIFIIDSAYSTLMFKFKNYLGILLSKFDNNKNPKSYNFFKSPFLQYINNSNYDLINLHWINAETLSIEDINKLKKPFMITMHDMWWVCGSENYLEYNDKKWKRGKFNNFFSDYIYSKKKNVSPLAIISPSKWLVHCVKKSSLFKKAKLINIPYPIDSKIYFPKKTIKSISKLKIYKTNKIKIFFVVFGNSKDKRKGMDLLIKSLNLIDPNLFELVIASKNKFDKDYSFNIKNLDYIDSEKQLSDIYNICDIVVIPSRLDNLPNVALEAQSCGKPLIAYNVGGLSDIIIDGYNGFLIKPFNHILFSQKLKKLIKNKKLRLNFAKNAYEFSKKNWSQNIIKKKYINELFKII